MAPQKEGREAQSYTDADAETRMCVLSALMVHLYPLKAATQRALPVAQVNQFSTSRNTIVVIVSMLLSLSLSNFMHREEEIEPELTDIFVSVTTNID